MTYLTWKDKQSGATRYGAEIVAMRRDEQGVGEEDTPQSSRAALRPRSSHPRQSPPPQNRPGQTEAQPQQESGGCHGVDHNGEWR